MKNACIFFALALFASCSGPQEPVFKRMGKVKVANLSSKQISLTAEAIYHNPNSLGGEITGTDIEVSVNGVDAGKVAQNLSVTVPAQAEFMIPLSFDFSPKDVFQKDKNGVLGGLLNAYLDRKVDVHYKGQVRMKIAGIPYSLDIDYAEEVKLEK